jgi:phage FluMu gp28-like protein
VSFRHHLVRWEDEFAPCGLVVVEVSGGKYAEFDFSRDRLARWEIRHRVLWDKDNKNIRAYDISGWPSAYLIGADGKVFWQGNPGNLRSRVDDERAFREALKAELEKARRIGK